MNLVSAIEKALSDVASALPDAARQLEHGAEAGFAISASSVELSGENVSASGAVEKLHVIVTASDFPTLAADDVVYLGDDPHVVTSLRRDPVGASATVGLSDSLFGYSAELTGKRGSRPIRYAVSILAEDNGVVQDYAEGFAPETVHSWTVAIFADNWPETTGPEIGDELRFSKDVSVVRARISRCERRGGHFVINARSRT